MKPNLPASIASRQDLKAVIMELQRYVQWSSRSDIKQRVAGQALAGQPALSPAAIELVSQWQAAAKPGEGLDKQIKALENFATKAPFATITLAAPASAQLRQAVVDWFRKNVRPDMLIDFKFDSTMLGGMAVRCGSHLFDWSFKRQILANRAKFPEVLRNV